MPRRKKKWMLLRGKFGNFIVVSREWYDRMGLGKRRGSHQMWWIAAESDDQGAMQAMALLTDRYVSSALVRPHG